MSVKTKGQKPVFIDAFAGCGGLSLGLLRSGWQGMFAIEKDAFAFSTLKANLVDPGARVRYDWPAWLEQQPWTIESLVEAHGEKLAALRGKVDLLAGGRPARDFQVPVAGARATRGTSSLSATSSSLRLCFPGWCLSRTCGA
ncbi:DNA cytosine methyltransferase [Mesorhizobium sp. M4B.F.Ca.ET.058.02.1.1]|uniref:DNA cytosine methyltransferase n=1 Tax=Mesorhizobium sp. M4B.F.Ca.ET.058.02.1.1 TaxID=2493675 RepID=UPI0024796FA3|nr:DNA cytosine methyltransferase [Mesorhizobium sp. M4B.F.Ca.ET.058.02.1.1]